MQQCKQIYICLYIHIYLALSPSLSRSPHTNTHICTYICISHLCVCSLSDCKCNNNNNSAGCISCTCSVGGMRRAAQFSSTSCRLSWTSFSPTSRQETHPLSAESDVGPLVVREHRVHHPHISCGHSGDLNETR